MSIGTHVAAALDPAELARMAGKVPDPWQAKALRALQRPDARVIACCGRQTGKSTVAAVAGLHVALFDAPAVVLLVSPSQDQSGELFKALLSLFRAMGRPVDTVQESALRLEFSNGSRVIALPGSEVSARGYAGVKMVAIDEAARVDEQLLAAVLPSVATARGRLMACSTPSFTSRWFYEVWTGADPTWARFHVPSTDCRRIPKGFLEEQRKIRGEFFWRTEYLAEFIDAETRAFARQHIEGSVDPEVEAWTVLGGAWR